MALSSQTVFEVRTTGSDSNGGGFVAGASGTDFSQQNSAQYTFSDLASSSGTTNPSVVTSASHNFVASDVGNIIQVTAGTNWTTGFYQIVSVAANAATLDRAVGSAASLSSGTYAVGGALLTPQKAFSAGDSITFTNPLSAGVIWIKSGTYTTTTPITTGAFFGLVVGYHTSRGDNDGTRPLLTTATNSTDLLRMTGAGTNGLTIDNVNFSNTAGTPAIGIASQGNNAQWLVMRRCKLTGFSDGINGDNVGARFPFELISLIACEIASCTSRGINSSQRGLHLSGCFIHNNTSDGAAVTGSNGDKAGIVVNCIFDTNGGLGLGTDNVGVRVINCVFSNNTSDGYKFIGGNNTFEIEVSNCVFYGNGGIGLNLSGTSNNTWLLGFNNAFGNNTGGNIGNYTNPFPPFNVSPYSLLGTITLTANPFTSSTNFAPNTTAGGGLLLSGAGYPGPYGSSTTSTPNVGSVQSNSASPPGGLLRADMTGGMYG